MSSKFRSGSGGCRDAGIDPASRAAHNNRANQLNPNNDRYYLSRGLEGRPNHSPDARPGKSCRG